MYSKALKKDMPLFIGNTEKAALPTLKNTNNINVANHPATFNSIFNSSLPFAFPPRSHLFNI